MGCASSKQKVCRNCQAPFSPVRRSYSMHLHHLPLAKDDISHSVALTSTTLGNLKLDSWHGGHYLSGDFASQEDFGADEPEKTSRDDFTVGMIEAKTWSRMIEEKIPKIIPKTPTKTPPGEPETINSWELMEGLEDISPLRIPHHHFRSFSFHVDSNPNHHYDLITPKLKENGDHQAPKPIWEEIADDHSNSNGDFASVITEFDPEVISTFRKALEELPPANPFHLKPLINDKEQELGDLDAKSEVSDDDQKVNEIAEEYKSLSCIKDKVLVYFTSLRGVRKTYEDCCHVRMILKGLGVKVDERDVSIHFGFKEEMKELLGEEYLGGGLPKVFVGRKFIGGAEEIIRMHELGHLEKVVESCEKVGNGGGGGVGNGGVCEACGDIRFVPCDTCSGSCRIYYEGDYDEEEYEEDEYGFQRCPDCNENGLRRCPICWD